MIVELAVVMAGLVPAIHAGPLRETFKVGVPRTAWMPGRRPRLSGRSFSVTLAPRSPPCGGILYLTGSGAMDGPGYASLPNEIGARLYPEIFEEYEYPQSS